MNFGGRLGHKTHESCTINCSFSCQTSVDACVHTTRAAMSIYHLQVYNSTGAFRGHSGTYCSARNQLGCSFSLIRACTARRLACANSVQICRKHPQSLVHHRRMRAGCALRKSLVAFAFSKLSSTGRSYTRRSPSLISVRPNPGSSGIVTNPFFGKGSPSNNPPK
eukprot:SAG31_NODE_2810_length_5061_cov_12.226522_5_plen_165_part_00